MSVIPSFSSQYLRGIDVTNLRIAVRSGLGILFTLVWVSGCGKSDTPTEPVTPQSQSATAPIVPQPTPTVPVVEETGTVKVEFDITVDPKSIITIGGNEYTRADLDKEIQLKPGMYTLTVTESGLALPPRSFSVEKDQRRVVRVFEPNRRAAEWVLGIGGKVRVVINGERQEIKSISDLPRANFVIDVIDTQRKPITDADLATLDGLTQLKALWIRDVPITGSGLADVHGLTELEVLGLERTKVDDASLQHLKEMPKLINLHLDRTSVTDAGLAYLVGAKLTALRLGGTNVTNAGMAHIKSLSSLVDLDLENATQISDAGVAHINQLPNLRKLNLQATGITDTGVAHLREFNLVVLGLRGTQTSDAALEHLSSMKNLSALSVGKAVTDAGLEHLKGLNKLVHLNVQGTKVTDNGLQQLRNALPNLKEILR